MNFRISRTRLTEDCRNGIQELFEREGIRIDLSALFTEIEDWLRHFKSYQRPLGVTRASSQRKREDLYSLALALVRMHADTEAELEDIYTIWYSMPSANSAVTPTSHESGSSLAKKVLAQTSRTHFIRMDDRGASGLPVPLSELKRRLLLMTLLAYKARTTRRTCSGPRKDPRRTTVAHCLLNIFESHTGEKATARRNGAFDIFLGFVLESAARESPETLRRTLIERAIKQREQLHPEAEMRHRLLSQLTTQWDEEAARHFLGARLTPDERRFIELQLKAKA